MTNIVKRSFKRLGDLTGLNKQQQPAAPPPAEPNIDEAMKNRDELDRVRRRRGVLANIFGGATSSGAPSVAVKRLLGE